MRSVLVGKFTISDANVTANQNIFEIQHYTESEYTISGLGVAGSVTTEVYTIAEFWKVR